MEKYKEYQEKNKQYLDKFNFENPIDCKAFEYFAKTNTDLKTAGFFEYSQEFKVKGITDISELKIGQEIEIEGYLSTFNDPDRENDVVLFGAFTESLTKQLRFPLLRDHRNNTDSQLGSFSAMEDEKGLKIFGKCLVTEKTYHTCQMMVKGHINTTSMGGLFRYKRNDDGSIYRGENGIWVIEKVVLFEGSVTPVPANSSATFIVKTMAEVEQKAKLVPEENTEPVSKKSTADKLKELNKLIFLKG